MKNIIIILCVLLFISCTSESDFLKAEKQLESQGYTDIKNTGYDIFCCSDSDQFSTGFEAKNSEGETVKGCICSGILKGSTIRYK